MSYRVACNKGNWTMALFDYEDRANQYLAVTLPDYIRRGYLMDKTLTPADFRVEKVKQC